ncbi:MAG: SDR family oxidoreductase [Saprospiraceae bacterium]
MRILLTGATGYIGKRLLPVLLEAGHEVICCVRDKSRSELKPSWTNVSFFEVDFLEKVDLEHAPLNFDVAYYLIHSMSSSIGDFAEAEATTARHFSEYMEASTAQQIIYLTGIVTKKEKLSDHLASRLNVEQILNQCSIPLTALRAGIVVGSGSASFEIIRDLVEKLPVMIAPKWLNSKCQPIAIRNVIQFLTGVLLREDCYNKNFDIGCENVLTYKEMLLSYAKVRNLNRWISTVPIMTPRLSSYWLYFVTSTTYELAVNLVDSMKIDVICRDDRLAKILNIDLISYEEAVRMAFAKIEQNMVVSSWKDALITSSIRSSLTEYVEIPTEGCFIDYKEIPIENNSVAQVKENIWSIGGNRGWYYGTILWKIRGYMDKAIGGIGLRRGRTSVSNIEPGDALDFWRVLVADDNNKRLLLYAEMKLPGDAWLEFKIVNKDGQPYLCQTATYRPSGLAGRLYWFSVLPFHYFVFNGMIRNIERYGSKKSQIMLVPF